ncbi:hypothetical protein B0J14DRAFT_114008 [Halenospora varia]|nr:hypothetical protein B0J14DRAFT_114008 [Halenospora varia]
MHLTRAVQSTQIKDVYVNRGSFQANAEDNLSVTTPKDKREWAELCLSQLGDQDVTLPVYKIARCDLPDAESVQPLPSWTQKKAVLYRQPENGTSVMVTPSGAYSDIHVDSTTIGRAVCVDRCTKVWLVWPPTDRNLQLWADKKGLGVALKVYGARLEGGIIIRTSGNKPGANAITLPAGTLHCVFTVFGGILTGTNYSTAEDIPLAARMLEIQVKRGQYEDQIEKDCSWLTKTVEIVINILPTYATSALSAVARLLRHIEDYERSQDDGWKKFTTSDAPYLFREYRRTLGGRKICSCNQTIPQSISEMRQHFLQFDHQTYLTI